MRRPTTEGSRGRARRASGASRIALAVAALLALLLVADFARMLGGEWEYARILRTDGTLLRAAEDARAGNRTLNVYVGLAVREVAGGAPERVVVPRDLGLLTSLPPDDFEGIPQPVLALHLLEPMLAGAIEVRDFDPRVPQRDLRRLLDTAEEVREYPMGVRAIVASESAPPLRREMLRGVPTDVRRDEIVLLTDAERETIVVAPLGLTTLDFAR